MTIAIFSIRTVAGSEREMGPLEIQEPDEATWEQGELRYRVLALFWRLTERQLTWWMLPRENSG
jgi:hypothetical protein